jgi:hypothetical protein
MYAGRTVLLLADGRRRSGCGDCDFTHLQWSAVIKHRADVHGAPALGRSLSMQDVQHSQQEIATAAAEPAPPVLTPTHEDVLPAPSKAVQAVTHGGPMAMTVGEIVELATHLHAAGAALERMTEDRDHWKAQALSRTRDLQKVQRILGKATDVVSKKEDI